MINIPEFKNKNIFYRPDLKPDYDYMSDAEYQQIKDYLDDIDDYIDIPEFIESMPSNLIAIKNLRKRIDYVRGSLGVLPNDLGFILEKTYDFIEKELDSIEAQEIGNIKINKITIDTDREEYADIETIYGYEDTTTKLSSDYEDIDLFPSNDIKIVATERPDIGSLITESSNSDSISIYEMFNNGLNSTIVSVLKSIALATREVPNINAAKLYQEFYNNSGNIEDNFRHLCDSIHRSQIERSQKARLMDKLHNVEKTAFHIRSKNTANELRKRYYESKRDEDVDYIGTKNNEYLRKARIDYDKKYKNALSDMYKYFNSANNMVEEISNDFCKECISKVKLKQEDIDPFEPKPKRDKNPRPDQRYKEKELPDRPERKALPKMPSKYKPPNFSAGAGGGFSGGGGGGGGGGTAGSVPGNSVKAKVWNALRKHGFTKEATAAIMGNLQQESGFDPSIVERVPNSYGTRGFGLLQWTGSRRTNIENAARSQGKDITDVAFQIDYLVQELELSYYSGRFPGGVPGLKSMTDINRCVDVFHDVFVASNDRNAGDPSLSKRKNFAQSIYNEFADKEVGGQVDAGGTGGQQDVVKAALSFLGTPYVWGGTTPSGFDCSGFVQYAYKMVGKNIPRNTTGQLAGGQVISPNDIQPGDLVLPHNGHVGMYIGNNQVVHSPQTGDVVRIVSITSQGWLNNIRRY